MERRELYDPEDIEQLLIERSFDDLLEEERAFVLRHLSDRNEYERMRALLLRMHTDEEDIPIVDAASSVRDRVMDVFRAQQQPHWRIWLNGVSAFMMPQDRSGYWRPALALGSLVLITTVALIGIGNMDQNEAVQLAELKVESSKQEMEKPTPTTIQEPLPIAGAEQKIATLKEEQASSPSTFDTKDMTVESESDKNSQFETPAVPLADVASINDDAEDRSSASVEEVSPSAAFKFTASDTVAGGRDALAKHHVTSNELIMNGTTATGSAVQAQSALLFEIGTRAKSDGKASRREKKAKAEEMADATEFVGLLRAAW